MTTDELRAIVSQALQRNEAFHEHHASEKEILVNNITDATIKILDIK